MRPGTSGEMVESTEFIQGDLNIQSTNMLNDINELDINEQKQIDDEIEMTIKKKNSNHI